MRVPFPAPMVTPKKVAPLGIVALRSSSAVAVCSADSFDVKISPVVRPGGARGRTAPAEYRRLRWYGRQRKFYDLYRDGVQGLQQIWSAVQPQSVERRRVGRQPPGHAGPTSGHRGRRPGGLAPASGHGMRQGRKNAKRPLSKSKTNSLTPWPGFPRRFQNFTSTACGSYAFDLV